MSLLSRLRPGVAFCLTFLLINLFISQGYAASVATSFCKCACTTNSTIIALNPPPQTPSHSLLRRVIDPLQLFPSSAPSLEPRDAPGTHHLTCLDCNRSFCRSHLLSSSLCSTAKDEEIFATCFQRDSLKDQIIVWTFILGVVGLVGWAVLREWVLPRVGMPIGIPWKANTGIPGSQ